MPIPQSANQFGEFSNKVLDATNASEVDILAHSEGTLIPGYYIKVLGGQEKINKYISLGAQWLGIGDRETTPIPAILSQLGIPLDRFPVSDVFAGSNTINLMNADGTPYLRGISYTNISSHWDTAVQPFTTGQVPGLPGYDVTNLVVQEGCEEDHSSHSDLAWTARTGTMILNALDPENSIELPCLQ
ncbi:MAG: esterase/lipase family protein [Mycobacteriaceae bacterium]